MNLNVLMVCLGNICRSPMAEGALQARLLAAGLERRVKVDSAATGESHIGHPPDPRAIETAARHGVDIAGQRARRLSFEDYSDFDVILCADRSILHDARIRMPRTSRCQVELMLEFAGMGRKDVPDPYYGSPRDFERSWQLVDGVAAAIVERVASGRL